MKAQKIPIILDTDIGDDIDDTWALGFLLKCPELDVKLITTANNHTYTKAKLVGKFLEKAGRSDIPIGIGIRTGSSKGAQSRWIKNYDLEDYPGIVYENGVDALCNEIVESSELITIIAIGNLTNIAEALKKNPNIVQNSRFVGMQGSINIGYEGDPNPAPEFNVLSNIKACREVFQAPWEKTITPLDTCGNMVLSGEDYKKFWQCDNSIVSMIKENYKIWAQRRKLLISYAPEDRSTILFDTVAVYLGFSEKFLNIENLKLQVTDEGFTRKSEEGNLIRCATSWKDEQSFKELLVNRLIH